MIQVGDIETDVMEHCNLRCAQCSHASPHFRKSDSTYTVDEFDKDISALSKYIHSMVFRFVGGEPLLNPQLEEWIDIAKFYKISDKVSLFTNGLLLDQVDLKVLDKIDDLRVSMYNLQEKKFKKILNNIQMVSSHRKEKQLGTLVGNHIRTFLKFNLTTKNEDNVSVKKVFDNCYHKKDSYTVFKGRLYRCFATRKKGKFLTVHKSVVNGDYTEMLNPETDSFNFHTKFTEDELKKFIFSDEPLEACKWCMGCSGPRFKNKQLKINELEPLTPDELDFEQGKKYVAYCLHSWYMNQFADRLHEIEYDEHYFYPDIEEFNKYHSSNPKIEDINNHADDI